MKILHIWNDYSPNLFDQTHPICLSKEIDSNIICANFIDNGAITLPSTQIFLKRNVKEQNDSKFYWKIYRRLKKIYIKKNFPRFVYKKNNEIKPNLIHYHFGNTAVDLENFLISNNTPQVISFYGVDISASLKDKKYVSSLKNIFKTPTFYFVLCEDAKNRLVNLGCPANKIFIWNLPPGIEQYPIRKRSFAGVINFLMAARFVEKKGHKIALAAFKDLLLKRKNIHLTLFGYGPSEWLASYINELKLNDYVTLINNQQSSNFTAQYNELLNTHHIFLAPSTFAKSGDDEGGPALTAIMAQSSGLPIIASKFPGSEISIIENKTGIFFDEKNPSTLTTIMNQVAEKIDDYSLMGIEGSKLVQKEFSFDTQGEKLVGLYEKFCHRDF
ncbi:MAG: glycosyltransferase [Oligoflexia bacterium]|nr:glycosyltransferase [Oligoflexia bacterium]